MFYVGKLFEKMQRSFSCIEDAVEIDLNTLHGRCFEPAGFVRLLLCQRFEPVDSGVSVYNIDRSKDLVSVFERCENRVPA